MLLSFVTTKLQMRAKTKLELLQLPVADRNVKRSFGRYAKCEREWHGF